MISYTGQVITISVYQIAIFVQHNLLHSYILNSGICSGIDFENNSYTEDAEEDDIEALVTLV